MKSCEGKSPGRERRRRNTPARKAKTPQRQLRGFAG
jgi:hypothetical protein